MRAPVLSWNPFAPAHPPGRPPTRPPVRPQRVLPSSPPDMASNGLEVLEAVGRKQYDLVLMVSSYLSPHFCLSQHNQRKETILRRRASPLLWLHSQG